MNVVGVGFSLVICPKSDWEVIEIIKSPGGALELTYGSDGDVRTRSPK